jgi:hypothetical protein
MDTMCSPAVAVGRDLLLPLLDVALPTTTGSGA